MTTNMNEHLIADYIMVIILILIQLANIFYTCMRPIPLVNYESHNQQNDEQSLSNQPHHHQVQQNRQHNTQYFGVAAFAILVTAVVVFKVFTSYDKEVENGRFYASELMSLELNDYWKLTAQKIKQQQDDKEYKIIKSDKPHAISRQQLGRQSWSLLHMITGSFPPQIDSILKKKFNTFLVLFGQMYPCKMCANHFMQLLKTQGLFEGNTKKQLMQYLCELHNKVNKRLHHPIHDCSNVQQEWNTCGCTGQATL